MLPVASATTALFTSLARACGGSSLLQSCGSLSTSLVRVHPLVQVYTIPRTGQLACVGHICNFRQKVSKFLSSLPTVPDEMPFELPEWFDGASRACPRAWLVVGLNEAVPQLSQNAAIRSDARRVRSSAIHPADVPISRASNATSLC